MNNVRDQKLVDEKKHTNFNQVIIPSKLRKAQSGVEMIDFSITLGIVELHCSCAIPDQGTSGGPVYVHIKPARPAFNVAPSFGPRRRPMGGNQVDGDDDGGDYDEVDEDAGNR